MTNSPIDVTAAAAVIAPVSVIAGPDPQSSPPVPEDDEISLLDLLQVIADNLRLLVLGPLAAGLIALPFSPEDVCHPRLQRD